MRVWLVDEKGSNDLGTLQTLLRELAERPETGLTFLGVAPYHSDFAAAMRSLMPEVVVINERSWPEDFATGEQLGLGCGIVIATAAERFERFRSWAELFPVMYLPPNPCAEGLWLALLSAVACQRRFAHYTGQIAGLQQRLTDRIVIERAKGVLVQRLGVTEEEAYKRLRLLSRRQRRPIRDIAQSLLDTQFLFLTDSNGLLEPSPKDDFPQPNESLRY
jgi:response regulator NasT